VNIWLTPNYWTLVNVFRCILIRYSVWVSRITKKPRYGGLWVRYGVSTGSICYDQGLDEHIAPTQKALKNQEKRPFWPKIFFACGALKRASPLAQAYRQTPHPITIIHAWCRPPVDVPGTCTHQPNGHAVS